MLLTLSDVIWTTLQCMIFKNERIMYSFKHNVIDLCGGKCVFSMCIIVIHTDKM